MPNTTRGRQVYVNTLVFDQSDFFQTDGFTRVVGLTPSQLVMNLFYNNEAQPWPFVDGTSISDVKATSGSIYWNAIPGAPGFYGVRFRPSAVGYWRLLISYPVGQQILAQDYDVLPASPTIEQGLKPSFVKPGTV
jgi:hypothetical protein